MMIINKRYRREDIKNNKWITYVFGDNDEREGYGGQAKACRGLPNSLGVRTKKRAGNRKRDYYTDDEYFDNISKIDEDLNAAEYLLEKGNLVVFPQDGLGTGRAFLRQRAPRTFAHLKNRLVRMARTYRKIDCADEIIVSAYDPTLYKLVPFAIDKNSFEDSLAMVNEYLTGIEVEVDSDPLATEQRMMRSLMRKIYYTLNGMDPKRVRTPISPSSRTRKDNL